MIRFLFRFLGVLLLAGAFILVTYDGTKSIADNNLYFTSVQTLWQLINAASLAAMRPVIEPYAGGILWDPVTVSVLLIPASGLLAFAGLLFMLLGRQKKPLIGYERP
jgi:peptidoglycan/LPS O-acetylase OafA/YrhL